jgi:NurA-like 5'-3' nuclease
LTNSSVSREFYGEHQVYFYYLNVGAEIARVEVPQWVALDESLLSLGQSLILDQCRRGQGYPVAISEAHEQAVIKGADRQLFRRMVVEALERKGLPVYTSEKDRSKRMPWL